MTEETEIRPVDPKGLEMSHPNPVEIPTLEHTKVDADPLPAIDDRVSVVTMLLLWIRENIINDILISREGVVMESKLWYASKTLWMNALVMLWSFVGPIVGIPVLTPELTFVLLAAANILLRLVTGQPIAILDIFKQSDPAKQWYTSKTLWFNVVSAAWILIGPALGIPTLPPDVFTGVLAVINIILRAITRSPVVFTE